MYTVSSCVWLRVAVKILRGSCQDIHTNT